MASPGFSAAALASSNIGVVPKFRSQVGAFEWSDLSPTAIGQRAAEGAEAVWERVPNLPDADDFDVSSRLAREKQEAEDWLKNVAVGAAVVGTIGFLFIFAAARRR